jgi:hypothetical protein
MFGPRDLVWHGMASGLEDDWLGMYYRSLRTGDAWHLKSGTRYLYRLGIRLIVMIKRTELQDLTDPTSN